MISEKEKLSRYEYRQKNKEQIALYARLYRERNKASLRAYGKAYRESNKEDIAEKNRRYFRDNKDILKAKASAWFKANPEKVSLYGEKQRVKSPSKVRARRITNDAVRTGELVRSPCVVCGEIKSEGHHEDYEQPLDVVWLCKDHHIQRHQQSARRRSI